MGIWQYFSCRLQGIACVGNVVDQQLPLPRVRNGFARLLNNFQVGLIAPIVALDAEGIEQSQIHLTSQQSRRNQNPPRLTATIPFQAGSVRRAGGCRDGFPATKWFSSVPS
jgi:hypothetical protein